LTSANVDQAWHEKNIQPWPPKLHTKLFITLDLILPRFVINIS
jgi:hypothetical protein